MISEAKAPYPGKNPMQFQNQPIALGPLWPPLPVESSSPDTDRRSFFVLALTPRNPILRNLVVGDKNYCRKSKISKISSFFFSSTNFWSIFNQNFINSLMVQMEFCQNWEKNFKFPKRKKNLTFFWYFDFFLVFWT